MAIKVCVWRKGEVTHLNINFNSILVPVEFSIAEINSKVRKQLWKERVYFV